MIRTVRTVRTSLALLAVAAVAAALAPAPAAAQTTRSGATTAAETLTAQESEMLALANDHPLTRETWIEPHHLASETLITYPVDRARLDIYHYFLDPAGVEPAARRTAELTLIILQLVASRRGVAALPNWVLADYLAHDYVTARPLSTNGGKNGLWCTLYAAVRANEQHTPYIQDFIETARTVSFRTLSEIQTA